MQGTSKDNTQSMDAEYADPSQQPCPRCQQTDFNYEDLEEGTKLVCRDCGYVLDEIVLVHQRGFDDDGVLQAGVRVAEADDGRMAGAAMFPSAVGRQFSRGNRSVVLSQNKERLDGALSFLELPPNIATAARQLLAQVVEAFSQAETIMHMSPATVAAVLYITARTEGRALSLGAAGSALGVPGPAVFKEFRRLVGVLDLEVPPPSLEAMVVHAASCLLPHYVPAMTGPLRRQPLVHKALQLTQLVQDTGAAEGRSPWVGAAAVWSIVLAEKFKDASSKAYAKQVAGHLQHSHQAVQEHISTYEKELASLLSLLPFTSSTSADLCVDVARNAATLLKLQTLSRLAG